MQRTIKKSFPTDFEEEQEKSDQDSFSSCNNCLSFAQPDFAVSLYQTMARDMIDVHLFISSKVL